MDVRLAQLVGADAPSQPFDQFDQLSPFALQLGFAERRIDPLGLMGEPAYTPIRRLRR